MIFLSLKFNKIEMIKINNKNLINNLMNSKFNSNNNYYFETENKINHPNI